MKNQILEFLKDEIKYYKVHCKVDIHSTLNIKDTIDRLFSSRVKNEIVEDIYEGLFNDIYKYLEVPEDKEEEVEEVIEEFKNEIIDFVENELQEQKQRLHSDIHYDYEKEEETPCDNEDYEDCLKEY